MADDVAITAGSGTNIAADERTINSSTVKIQRVGEIGASAFKADQIAPTTTATSASIAARETRKRITITNRGTVDLYISDVATNAGSPATTTDNSFKLDVGASCVMQTTAGIYIFTASGTGAAHYWEEYDS